MAPASNFHTYHLKAQSILNRKGQNVKKPVYSCIKPVEQEWWCFSPATDKVGNCPWKECHKIFHVRCCFPTWWWSTGFKQCGLFVKPDYPYLAASADDLFFCKCCVQLLRPSVLTLYEMRISLSRTHLTEPTCLKLFHKYYNLGALMWVCGVCHGFSLFGRRGTLLTMIELNLTWNFVLLLWTIIHCFTSHLFCHAVRVQGYFWLPKVQ